MRNIEKLILEKKIRQYKKNPFSIVKDGLMKIKPKTGGIINLVPNNIQLELLNYIESRWNHDKPIMINVLKARQFGISTLISAIFASIIATMNGINGLVITDRIEGSQYMLDMYKLFYRELNATTKGRLVPTLARDNINGIMFKEGMSRVLIDTASNVSAGRKYTLYLLHCSEVCFWPINPQEIMIGLMQAMPNTRCLIINETTANGVGDYFYNEFKRGMEGSSDWVSLFFGWHEYPGYEKDYVEEDKKLLLNTLSEEEDKLIYKFKDENKFCEDTIIRKLIWRRWCIKNKCQGDINFFHQEYPTTWEEAFLVSGRSRFSTKALLHMQDECVEPIKTGCFTSNGFEELPKGMIKIYREPDPIYGKYVVGIDPATGKLVAKIGGRADPDNHSLHVLDSKTEDVVATMASICDPDVFAEQALKLAKYYNTAFVGIENNIGQAMLAYFKRMNYWNLYQNVIYDEQLDRELKVLGWNTNIKTKRLMIDELAIYIRERLGKINDRLTIAELFTFIIKDDGKVEAQDGCHDDRVISLAIAIQMLKHQKYMEELLTPTAPIGSWEYELDIMLNDAARQDRINKEAFAV